MGPGLPLQFVLNVLNVVPTNTGATADFVFQPLSLGQGENLAGACIGEPLEFDAVQLDAEGNFDLDMGLVMVVGAANPITGSDIEATLTLHGHLVDPDAMCGEVQGMVIVPLDADLTGSTFAAIPLDGGCDADPFPPPIYKCSML